MPWNDGLDQTQERLTQGEGNAMPTKIADFVRAVDPEATILLFGAGSSVPSGAPTVADILEHFAKKLGVPNDGFTLPEYADLVEYQTKDRRGMISALRELFKRTRPTGGILNLPLYAWKSIYTTNYDTIIEQAFTKKDVPLTVYRSNWDFSATSRSLATKLYKLHGCIEDDVSTGSQSRIIISGNDYTLAHDYRQHLYNTLKAELAESRLVIIGHSLTDPDIKEIVNDAIALNAQTQSGGRITLFMFREDLARAALYEAKGLDVVFGGIDEFFAEMGKKSPGPLFDFAQTDDHLAQVPALVPVTIDVTHEIEARKSEVSRMFNGWPATYADIDSKLTFDRAVAGQIAEFLTSPEAYCAVLVGASGVGKTTAARQALTKLRSSGTFCWEHQGDHTLGAHEWVDVARSLRKAQCTGILFVDDAHGHLYELNDLIDRLVTEKLPNLRIVMASSRNNWRPRIKSPNLFKHGKEFFLSKVSGEEIDRLLSLVEQNRLFDRLVANSFAGFSRTEKRRRLVERCESDMFVCMKNIFTSENFDNIILREFADLAPSHQDIYRLVATLEHSGVHVHRQLVIRLLGIPMATVMALLESLTDIITEYTIDDRRHIYGWKGRHAVINGIIARYKYPEIRSVIKLFDLVIDNISPTYEVEIRSIVELCNIDTGIARIPDKKEQNRLLRKMVSVVPGVRVPRHRLIRNLIDIGEFEQAATGIRLFEKDFPRGDGPVARYKITLTVARAIRTPGILNEDRITILEEARQQAIASMRRFPYAAAVYAAYCDVGFHLFRLTANLEVFDDAMAHLREAESELGDPAITAAIRKYSNKLAGAATPPQAVQDDTAEPDEEAVPLEID